MEKQQMFRDGELRYLTSGIDERLPPEYQILIWNTIDNLRDAGQELDYLQVFRIETVEREDGSEKIIRFLHSQEVPPFEKVYELPVKPEDVSLMGKVYVIDDITHATMLWAEEY